MQGSREPIASTSGESETSLPGPYKITEETLQKRMQSRNKGRYITQLLVAVAVSVAALSFGTALGWSSPAIRYVMKPLGPKVNITEKDYQWLASLMPLGCSVGVVPWTYAVDKFGPKRALIMQTPLYVFTFLLLITIRTLKIYMTARFFSGFISICNIVGGECLLLDSVDRSNLKHMIAFFRSSILLGVLLAYLVGHYSSRIGLLATCAGIPVFNILLLIVLPESPVYLYNKSELKAEEALSWYRGHTNIYTEMRSLRKDAEIRKVGSESYKYMFLSKVIQKAILIVLGLIFFQVFTGYYAFIFYSLQLWDETEAGMWTPFIDSIIFGICMFVSNLVGNLVHYRVPFGVRKPLLTSITIIAIVLTVVTVYLFLDEYDMLNTSYCKWIPFVMMNSFVVAYEMGLSTYPDILLSDYLPYQVYNIAKLICHMWRWLQIFFVTKYFSHAKEHMNYYATFGILTITSYVGILYCYFFVIESKGKNLLQLQIEIGGNPIGNRGAYRTRIGTSAAPNYI